jgi:acetyl/propionyl-CoA carboxylase alpha subunit/acetyl-CoA carboxylase carboxyltransferase component
MGTIRRLLVANRGEVALRIVRAAGELGIETVVVHAEDDGDSLAVRRADRAVALRGAGPAAYLDAEQLVAVATSQRCDAVHPGYGFLAEQAAFARRCREAGLVFVGPEPATLAVLGDKVAARALAARCGLSVVPGTEGPTTPEEAHAFLASLGNGAAVMVKAVAGGGGRGMRPVTRAEDLATVMAACAREAAAAFGDGAVYVERLVPRARHVEVQLVGDGSGAVIHLHTRECSVQRRRQKLVEIAPAPCLADDVREGMTGAAVRLGEHVRYAGVGTVELLLDLDARRSDEQVSFLEANARLQVEHTVTEQVTGVDLVQTQLLLAGGARLGDLGLDQAAIGPPRGVAVQARVNAERVQADGTTTPATGTITAYEPPGGPGVRVDGWGFAGATVSGRYDSLLAKVIGSVPSDDLPAACGRTARAVRELRVEGVATNAALLVVLLERPEVAASEATTTFVDEHLAELVPVPPAAATAVHATPPHAGLVGARIDAVDPLAVLDHGKAPAADPRPVAVGPVASPDGSVAVPAPLQGTVVAFLVAAGDLVHAGQPLLLMEAMKMEHVVVAPDSGRVLQWLASEGDAIAEGHPLAFLEPLDVAPPDEDNAAGHDLDHVRPDLAEVLDRHAVGLDAARPDVVERRRAAGQRTARENVEDLCDPGTFVEYGPLVIAAQRRRRSIDDLIARTPADGLVSGLGSVNGDLFPADRARCVIMSYDYTVLAGTQGLQNHRKKDRLFELAERWRLPVVFFTEGGGGRPGDTDAASGVAGLDCLAFHLWGRLSGLVPLVGITSGRCFAGNAALLGCCDVVIATADSTIGMGGPAMIEGGGLGVFRPEEVGPMAVQVPSGVVDIAVDDEAAAVAVAKRYLSYFQGPLAEWEAADQRLLRTAVPENRLRVYDVRWVIDTMMDAGSVLELRSGFGRGMVTALARVEGQPMGVVANDPTHLGGAIDADGSDKAARFMQLCDAFDLPMLFLCDTPGMMVGPEAEKTGLVRHCSRLFVTGANLTVPFFTIVLRKMYGLGGQAMAGGSTKAPMFTVAWPTGEFGGMGLEGYVKLGFRNELAAVGDPEERKALFEQMVARAYEHGKAVNTASHFEIDDVIDPADSRAWITRALRSVPPPARRDGKKRPNIDTW